MIYSGSGIILVCAFSCPFDVTFSLLFSLWYQMGKWYWCICLYFLNLIFGNFPLFGVTVKSWLLIGWKNYRFFSWFISWISSDYNSTIGTLGGSELVIRFDYGAIFIWVPSWFIYWNFFWPASLTVTLGGTAGGFNFLNTSVRVFNASLFTLPNFTNRLAGSVLCSA